MQSTSGERGLTLVEMSIIAVIAAITIPNLRDQRVGANESSAISSLRTVVASESSYHAVVGVYAGNFQTLIDTGFLSSSFFPTVLGTKSGYIFTLCAAAPCDSPGASPPIGADGSAYKALAVPASVATAHRVFTVDDSELLVAVVGGIPSPADEVIDPQVGPPSACQTGCVTSTPPPIPSQVEIDAYANALVELATTQAIPDIDALVPEDVISLAAAVSATPLDWGIVMAELDADSSGSLDWSEVLTPDLLAVARVVKTINPGSDPGPSVGPDTSFTVISQDYQADLSALLALGTADEGPTPPFAITGASGDPLALLLSLLNAVPVLGWLATGLLVTAILGVGMRTSRART